MMENRILISLFVFLAILSCKKKEEKTPTYYKGTIDLVADDSFKSVATALADAYTINYPDSEIKVVTQKEDLAFLDLLKNKAKLIIMSRDLSQAEVEEYKKQTELKFQPAKFAADAVVFIVPKNSLLKSISFDEIKKELNSESKRIIFDGTNSSNINFVAQKFNSKPSDLKFSIIPGNEKLIEELHNFPDKIGVIGLNTISRPYGKEAEMLRNEIKVLPVLYNNKLYEPSTENLRYMTYPFTRVLYFLTNEGNFNLANGIIRFSCTHIGQKVVEKEGLQPYNIYKREVQMK